MAGPKKPKTGSNIAYLVIRDGKKWSDVFRLMPGRTVTIGRSPTNQIVIKEDQASRQHAEIFSSDGKWTVRDLNSRNGTAVGKERVTGDYVLKPQEIIWIASTQMAFVTDLSSAYNRKVFSRVEIGSETVTGLEIHDSDEQATMAELQLSEPTQITHRRQKTRYLQAEDPDSLEEGPPSENARSKASRNATRLCRLAFDLANETTPRAIARMALDCLHEETKTGCRRSIACPQIKTHNR